jgi:hypothetical protein
MQRMEKIDLEDELKIFLEGKKWKINRIDYNWNF